MMRKGECQEGFLMLRRDNGNELRRERKERRVEEMKGGEVR